MSETLSMNIGLASAGYRAAQAAAIAMHGIAFDTRFGDADISPDTTSPSTLVNTVGLPTELFMAGIYPALARKTLLALRANAPLQHGEVLTLLHPNGARLRVAVFNVSAALATRLLPNAAARLPPGTGGRVSAMQAVMQDPAGKLPWEPGYDAITMAGQTLFYKVQ